MDIEKSGNLIEASLWLCVAAVWILKAFAAGGRLRLTFVLLAISFALFGFTDLIESKTGAWWRPLWLLGLKGICVIGFAIGFMAHYRLTRSTGLAQPETEPRGADP